MQKQARDQHRGAGLMSPRQGSPLPTTKPRLSRGLVQKILIGVMLTMFVIVGLRAFFGKSDSVNQRAEEAKREKDASQASGRADDFAKRNRERLNKAEAEQASEASAVAAAQAASSVAARRMAAAASAAGINSNPAAGGVNGRGAQVARNTPLPAQYRVPPAAGDVGDVAATGSVADAARLADRRVEEVMSNQPLAAYEESQNDGKSGPSGPADQLAAALKSITGAASPATGAGGIPDLASVIKGATSGGVGPGTATQAALGVGPKNEQWLASRDKSGQDQAPLVASPATSPYTLQETGEIKVVILQGLNSTLPTKIRAMVTDDVYDTITGTHKLIRAGSIVAADPNTDIARGQDRMMVSFSRLLLRGGASMNLGAMSGSDAQGYGGIDASVNSHWVQRWGSAFLVAGVATLAQRNQSGVNVSLGGGAESAAESSLNQVTGAILNQNMNIQDTLTVKPGQKMTIVVTRDLVLPPSITGNEP